MAVGSARPYRSSNIAGADLTRVSGVFGWSAKGSDQPGGAVFFLDDIQVDRSLPARSVPTTSPSQSPTTPTPGSRRPCVDPPPGTPPGTLDVLDGGLLCAKNSPVGKYEIGVDTSGQLRSWLAPGADSLRMDYPGGQDWGAVFVTVGDPVPPGSRPGQNLSSCTTLLVDLRSPTAGARVGVGMKDATDPDDGSEPKVQLQPKSTWTTYQLALTGFTNLNTASVYVILEFVYAASDPAETIYFRNIRLRC